MRLLQDCILMILRPELVPPKLDEKQIAYLAKLASMIDGATPSQSDQWLAEFNCLAKTSVPFEHFQGISGGEEHTDWVRRLRTAKQIKVVSDVTRNELIELVRRAMPQNGYSDAEAYMAIFEAHVACPYASDLIFHPPGGEELTAEEVVEQALSYKPITTPPPRSSSGFSPRLGT